MRSFLNFPATARKSSALLFTTLILLQGSARADLGSYEQAATQQRVESPSPPPSTQHDDTPDKDCDDPDNVNDLDCKMDDLLLKMMEAVLLIPVAMAWSSVEREFGDRDHDIEKRHAFERDIPHLAVDINWHDVHSDQDIRGTEGRLEAGWGPLAVEASRLRYEQRYPDSELEISRLHVLLRGTMKVAQLNVGLGTVEMQGREKNRGTSVLVALSLFPNDHFSVDSRWTGGWINGSRSNEYDLALGLWLKACALRAGYRYNVAEGESLRGPYAGLSLRY